MLKFNKINNNLLKMEKKEILEKLFNELPGVGPRQAKRFVYSILHKDKKYAEKLSKLILEIKDDYTECQSCKIFFKKNDKKICHICLDKKRDGSKILIIEKNNDFENLENSKLWNGKYFLIGRNLKLNEENKKININPLIKRIKTGKIKEIIFALSLTPEGEKTKEIIKNEIEKICLEKETKISELGKGLSFGTELEYSDKITLDLALKNRKEIK